MADCIMFPVFVLHKIFLYFFLILMFLCHVCLLIHTHTSQFLLPLVFPMDNYATTLF